MPRPKHEFGPALFMKAASVGRPGERRFNVRIEADGGKALAWVEKQELLQLALGIQELLVTHPPKENILAPEPLLPGLTPPNLEFQVSKLVMGYNRRTDRLVFEFSDEEAVEEDRPTLRVSVDRTMIAAFADEAIAVCSAGRPLCPLCGAPMGPGEHACPRRNGHVIL